MAALLFMVLALLILIISFSITSGMIWVVCWAFGLAFSWRLAVGIWVVLIILRSIFKSNVNVKK